MQICMIKLGQPCISFEAGLLSIENLLIACIIIMCVLIGTQILDYPTYQINDIFDVHQIEKIILHFSEYSVIRMAW